MSNQTEELSKSLTPVGRAGSSTPQLVKDITPGKQSSYFSQLRSFNDAVYFTLEKDNNKTGSSTFELWKSDGTGKGTNILKNLGKLAPITIDSGLDPDTLYFTTVKDDGNYETLDPKQLWKTDGTTKGTQQLKNFGAFQLENLYSGLDPDTLYFTTVKDDGNYETLDPKQLWKTDGTPKGTQLVKEFGNSGYFTLTNFKDKIYFPINQENKNQLWKTDGTTKGTQLVKNFGGFEVESLYSGLDPDTLYFTTVKDDGNYDTLDPKQLWKTDGTTKGTQLVKELGNSNDYFGYDLTNFKDKIYFPVNQENKNQLWKTDGTTKGTQQLKNFGAFEVDNLYSWLDPDTLYFTTFKDDGNYATLDPKQLWKTDGTPKGTQLVKEFGNVDGYFTVTNFKDKIYFPINQENKNQLWKTDGTTKGTQQLKNFGGFQLANFYPRGSDPDILYFTTFKDDGNYATLDPQQLWKTDGTPKGTQQLKNFGALQLDNFYSGLDPDTVYFTTVKNDGNYETIDPKQLWKTDGTPKGTQLVKELGNSNDYHLTNFKDKIYFTVNQENKNQLWKTDGTTKGTQLVKNFGAFQLENLYSWLDPDTLYFTTVKDDGNYETPDPKQLWKTDGTTKGTKLVQDLGEKSSFKETSIGSDLYYTAKDAAHGLELWKLEGSNDPLTLSAKEDVLLNSGNSNASALSSQDDSILMYQMGMNSALLPLENSSLAASGMGQSSLLMGKQQGLGFTQENTLFPLPETSQII
jgi:ELWxxDGT repeat protein